MDKILRGNEFLREQNESKREKYKGERERVLLLLTAAAAIIVSVVYWKNIDIF
jgi:hypothetical protein